MPSKVTVKATGLCLQGNDMALPEGALSQAENVVITRDNIVETRRGYTICGTKALARLFPFKEYLVGWAAGVLSTSADGATWLNYSGTLSALPDAPVRVAEASSDLFLTSSDGVKRLDAIAGTPEAAGVPAALDPWTSMITAGFAVQPGNQVAYRVVWGKRDASGRLILGSPSGRTVAIVAASGSATDPLVGVQPPPGVNGSNFLQVYRSIGSGGESIAPSDELQLAVEIRWPSPVTASISIASNVLHITTAAPHGLSGNDSISIDLTAVGLANRGYTLAPDGVDSPTQFHVAYVHGDVSSTPVSVPVAIGYHYIRDNIPDEFLQAALYTNETQEGISQSNDVPPIARDLATFRNSVFFGDIQQPATLPLTLIAVGGSAGLLTGDTITINGTVVTLYAYGSGTPQQLVAATAVGIVQAINAKGVARAAYVSGADDPAGKMAIYALPGEDLTIVLSRPSSFLETTYSAKANRMQNGLAWSKTLQPDAVPTLNSTKIASADREILRIIPTRDSLFILKREDGVFRLTGDSPSTFRVDPFDYNTHLVAAETARALDNKIFMLTEQGVVALTDTGVELVSRAIETALFPLLAGSMRAVTESLAFGVAVESDRKYLLFLPSAVSDTTCTQAYVYDLITQAWTHWNFAALHGVSNPADDRLYFVDGVHVLQERKAFADSDYQAPSGDVIPEIIEWTPQFAQPGMFHEFQDVVLSFRRAGWTAATVSFATDLDTAWEDVTLPAQAAADHVTKRIVVPRNKARGSLLRVKWSKNEASAPTKIQALTVNYVPGVVPAVVK